MNELAQLEAMGYRFRLEGDLIRYELYGEAPPPKAAALLRRLDKARVKQILQDRAQGHTIVQPDTLTVPWGSRYAYLRAIKAALDAGALLHVQATYIRRTRQCIYHLHPPGIDLLPWLEGCAQAEAKEENP